jgi:hypothetical protein
MTVALLLRRRRVHVFLWAGAASGTATQVGFEVEDIEATVAQRAGVASHSSISTRPALRWSTAIAEVGDNYATKRSGERGAWFRDSEGNLPGLGQPTR